MSYDIVNADTGEILYSELNTRADAEKFLASNTGMVGINTKIIKHKYVEGWNKNPDKDMCPDCNGIVEVYMAHDFVHAERCPKCEWQISFNPNVHRVPYGSKVICCRGE